MKKITEILKNKKLKIIMTAIRIIIAILLICFFIVVCLQRFSNNKISILNYRMFTVVSGSMVPKYNIGDVLIAKETDPSKIKVGDDVSYQGKVSTFDGKVITHEVRGIEKGPDGKYLFHTKGKANLVEDPLVSEEQLLGVVIYKDPLLSLVYGIISTKIGFYLFIIIPLMFIVGSEILKTMLSKEEKRREQNNQNL